MWNPFGLHPSRNWTEYRQPSWRSEAKCSRCGIYAGRNHDCKAIKSKCFKCGLFNHFARSCRTVVARCLPRKSEKRKQRDLERLTKYNEQKAVMTLFPFSKLDDNDFRYMISKMDNTLYTELNVTKKRLADFRNGFWDTSLKLAQTEHKLEGSEKKVKDLQSQIDISRSPYAAMVKEHEEEKAKLNNELRETRTKFALMVGEVNRLTSETQWKDGLIEQFKLKVTEYFGLYKRFEEDSLMWKDKYEQLQNNGETGNQRRKRGNRK